MSQLIGWVDCLQNDLEHRVGRYTLLYLYFLQASYMSQACAEASSFVDFLHVHFTPLFHIFATDFELYGFVFSMMVHAYHCRKISCELYH